MTPGFIEFVQQVFVAEGAKLEVVDDATFKLRIKRSHPKYERLVALFQEFQTRANMNGLEVQHLYKPGGHDRVLELLRDILGPEQHARLVADLQLEYNRRAEGREISGAVASASQSQIVGKLMQRAFEDRVIPAASTITVNKVEAMARGEKVS